MATMSPARKRLAILFVLAGSVLIAERAVSLAGEEPDGVESVVRPRPARAAAPIDSAASSASAGVRLDRLEARQRSLAAADDPGAARAPRQALFASVSWAPAPPPKPPLAPSAPPPNPVAPPFPYSYMGGLSDDGVRTAFFNKGERVLAVKTGDTVDGTFRVEQLSDKHMQLIYLPLNQSVSMPLGGSR